MKLLTSSALSAPVPWQSLAAAEISSFMLAYLLLQVSTALTGKGSSGTAVEPYVLARLKADMESQVNALKNASYAAGYAAGKGEIVAHAQRTYA